MTQTYPAKLSSIKYTIQEAWITSSTYLNGASLSARLCNFSYLTGLILLHCYRFKIMLAITLHSC
jgi:hypothetical protein